LLGLLKREGLEETIKSTIVDNMFGFIYDPEHVNLAIKWLESGTIFSSEEEKS